jgi:hypothetical protein
MTFSLFWFVFLLIPTEFTREELEEGEIGTPRDFRNDSLHEWTLFGLEFGIIYLLLTIFRDREKDVLVLSIAFIEQEFRQFWLLWPIALLMI